MKKETKKTIEKENKKNIKYSFNYLLDFVTNLFINAIKKINKFLTDKKKNVIVRFIIRIAFCLLMLAILEIPFIIVEKIGVGILYLLGITFKDYLSVIWINVIDYVYILFSLIVLFRVIYDMSKRKDYKIEIKESNNANDNLYYVINTGLKVLIAVSLIPLILMGLMLFAVLGMLICFITNGVFILGPIIMVIGLLIMIISSLSYIYDIVFFDKGGNK